MLEDRDVKTMPYDAARLFMVLGATTSVVLIVANIAAVKLWSFCGLPADAGLLLFPITYIIGDISVEIYGKNLANQMALCSGAFAVVTAVILWLANLLPDYPGADNTTYYLMSKELGRMFLASIAAFVASELTNNAVFAKIRRTQLTDNFYARALLSSAVARVVDECVFEITAFYGKLPLKDFLMQMLFAFVIGMVLEGIFSPVTNWLSKWLPVRVHYNNGNRI